MRVKHLIMRYKLPTFLIAVISLAFILVSISMSIYYSSGAFQLDLSRPEYKSVRSQIAKDSKLTDKQFDTQGEISERVLDQFLDMYKEKSDKLIEAKAFSSDVLNDEQLGL